MTTNHHTPFNDTKRFNRVVDANVPLGELDQAITNNATAIAGKAASTHTHVESDITDLATRIKLLASVSINCQTATKQTLYTVPTGKVFILDHIVIRQPSASLAGMTDADFGAGANADDWLQQISLDSYTATTDCGKLQQPEQAAGPPIVPTKTKVYVAADVFGILINTGSTGAATVTMDLFGYLADA